MAREDETDWVFRDRHPERGEVYARMDSESERAYATLKVQRGLHYGDHPREALDLFPGQPGAPLVVFFHGGYWQSLSRERFAFVAEPLVRAGYSVALPGYPLAPEASLSAIVAAASIAVKAATEAATAAGLAPSGWIAAGHSAGAHLALMTALSPQSVPLRGVVAISPICDLDPLRGTSLDSALKLTTEDVRSLSPARLPLPSARVQMIVGADETAGFRGQTFSHTARMVQAGHDCSCRELPGLNHYTIPLEIRRPYSSIMAAVIELTGTPAGQGGTGLCLQGNV